MKNLTTNENNSDIQLTNELHPFLNSDIPISAGISLNFGDLILDTIASTTPNPGMRLPCPFSFLIIKGHRYASIVGDGTLFSFGGRGICKVLNLFGRDYARKAEDCPNSA